MRIYNPQNQFGENLITSIAVDAIKTTILKGMGMSEADINALVSDDKGGYLGTLAAKIEANAESIGKLTAGSLEYKTVAYAENVQTAYANETYYNKILLVPASPVVSEGVNKYTEYIIVKVGDSTSSTYYAEKLGEIGVDATKITTEIGAINAKIAGEKETLSTTAHTLTGAINEVKSTADSALQDVNTVSAAGSNGITLSASKDDNNNLTVGLSVSTGSVTEGNTSVVTGGAVYTAVHSEETRAKGVEGELSSLSTDAKGSLVAAINEVDGHVDAITTKVGTVPAKVGETTTDTVVAYVDAKVAAEDTAVNGKSVAMESMTGAVTADAKVKVAITGTIGEHSIAVTTNDIASATTLSALDTYVKGDKVTGDGGAISGGIEKRLAAVETSIGSGTEGIGARVTTLEGALGTGFSSETGKTVAARMNAVEGVAGTALQGITGDNTKAVKVAFTEDTAHEVTTTVTVTTASTTGSGNAVAIDLANNDALVTAKVASDAIAAAEARAKEAQTYFADGVTISVDSDKKFSALTGDVASGAATLTTGGQVHTAIEAAKTALIGDANTADTIKKAQATAEAAQTAADNEKTARQTDVGAILAGTKHAIGTVVVCAVSASATDGTFTVTKPTGVSSVHIMRVEWKHEDFVCKHDGENITLWDANADFGTNAKPAASEIQVFALVTGTTAKAEGVTA